MKNYSRKNEKRRAKGRRFIFGSLQFVYTSSIIAISAASPLRGPMRIILV